MPVAKNRQESCQRRLIADRYALEHPIGRGGMGVVWQARDRLLDREVAIKEVTVPDTVPKAERDSLRARVMREARAAARLSHPGAITLFDVLDEPDRAFIVMELVRARTLAEIVATEGPLPPERVARIGLQIASTLDAAHRAGIVHRDVKPANVMVDEDGGARLADFGIAQVQGDDHKLTSAGMIVGSPAYMAPEQASGQGSGPETDLWGLGGTMYYAVEGKPPFERDNSIATLTAVVKAAPRPPRRAGALAPIIMALLAKDPADRPSLRQLRMRLARIITAGWEATAAQPALSVREAALALPPPETSGLSTATVQIPVPPRALARLRRRWSRRWLAPVAFVLALLVILLATAVARPSSSGSGHAALGAVAAPAPAAAVPVGWGTFSDPGTGYRIASPPGWHRETSGPYHRTVLADGDGRAFQIESARPPLGDPMALWTALAASFAKGHRGYHKIHLGRGRYHGMSAAVWEFTHPQGGRTLHKVDVTFTSPKGQWGYAVLFTAPARLWPSSQVLVRAFEQGFIPLE